MQRMRNQIEQLQAELLYVRGDSGTPFEELQVEYYIRMVSICAYDLYFFFMLIFPPLRL